MITRTTILLLVIVLVAGCSNSEDASGVGGSAGSTPTGGTGASPSGGTAGGTSTGGSSGNTASGGSASTGGASGNAASGGITSTGGTPSAGASGSAGTLSEEGGAGGETVAPNGRCGLAAPAFCDTFEQGPVDGGRSGELDPEDWSVLRAVPTTHSELGFGFEIGPAYLPECRPGVSGTYALPDEDTRICEPTASIGSRHLLAAVAAQNYGLNTYRIRYAR
jgi:hypothetical protein